MVDSRLVKYIQTSLSQKIPINEIKSALQSKGWRDSDINDAINAATQPAQVSQISQKKPPLNFPKQTPQKKPPVRFPTQKISPRFPTQPVHKFAPQQFQTIQKPKENKFPISKNLIFISIGIFALLLIGVIVFLFLRNASSISDDQLTAGVSVDLKQNKDIKFKIDEEEHTITVNSISGNSVSLTILSNPITITLETGGLEKIDFEHDGTYDLSIKLNTIIDGKVNVMLKKISEQCIEEWDCTNWTDCEEGLQTRDCTDLTDCGTERNKPDETQECELLLSCASQSGLICDETETCDGDIVNSTSGDCCLGSCIGIEAVDCGTDVDCFIYQAENCTLSNLTYESNPNNVNWTQTDTIFFEIKGLNEEKCEIYGKLLDSYRNFTEAGRTALEDEGKNSTEIDQIEQQINNELFSMIGNSETCFYPIADLVENLETMDNNGYFELSSEDITTYNCTGSLY